MNWNESREFWVHGFQIHRKFLVPKNVNWEVTLYKKFVKSTFKKKPAICRQSNHPNTSIISISKFLFFNFRLSSLLWFWHLSRKINQIVKFSWQYPSLIIMNLLMKYKTFWKITKNIQITFSLYFLSTWCWKILRIWIWCKNLDLDISTYSP